MAVGDGRAHLMNPYVPSLAQALESAGHAVDVNAGLFWDCRSHYDIVHIHWPLALFDWNADAITQNSVDVFRARCEELKAKGSIICYTRHNSDSHACDNRFAHALHLAVEEISDVVIHLGESSEKEYRRRHPDSAAKQFVIPHHTYGWYPRDFEAPDARRRLKLPAKRATVLSFGEFRSDEERLLLAEALPKVPGDVQLVAPMLLNTAKEPVGRSMESRVRALLGARFPVQRCGRVSDELLPLYFAAADVVFIQRRTVLNSGNLPLAFHFGKVVVGPDRGNVGEILKATGNPTFDPDDPDSVAAALARGLELAAGGKGRENLAYADANWDIQSVASRLADAYLAGLEDKGPCVTIIMPSLNTAQYIGAAIDSVLGQTLKNIELICVDAGSSDGTREIIARYAAKDDRVKVIDSPVKSYGRQMNMGVAAAKGLYVGTVDPDDYIAQDMCEELYRQASRESLDVIKGKCVCFTGDGKGDGDSRILSPFCGCETACGTVFDPVDIPEIVREGTLGTAFGLYRRSMLIDCGIRYNESPGASYQDTGFFFQTMICARRFKPVDKAYHHYRLDNQASSRNDKSKLMTLWREYEFVDRQVSAICDKARLDVFRPYILGRNFSGQLWTARRVGFSEAKDLIDAVKRKFAEHVARGEMRSRHMAQADWRVLVSWMKDYVPESCGCKVSVIIPCCNVAQYLRECLDSVLKQSLREIEAVCVDDGSTDNTGDILGEYAKKDSRVVVLKQKNKGVYAARNRAIGEAKGEFVAFMDPDDLYPSNGVLERLYVAAKSNGLLAAGGSMQSFTPDGAIIDRQKPQNVFSREETVPFSRYQWALGYQRFIFSRLLLDGNGISFPPFTRFQDPPFMAAALIAAEEFRSIPDVVYSYRIGYKRPDWAAHGCRKFRDLLVALDTLAGQAFDAGLPDLLGLAESELAAHLDKVVKPDRSMLKSCAGELSKLRQDIARYKDEIGNRINARSSRSAADATAGAGSFRATRISILKMAVPYGLLRLFVARKYGFAWPHAGLMELAPFILASALMQRRPGDRRIAKYLMPYGWMCERMLRIYGLSSWNGVPLDGASLDRPCATGLRALLPFGTILFLDKHSA